MAMRSERATNFARFAWVCATVFATVSISDRSTAGVKGGGIPDARIGTRLAPLLLLSRSDVRADLRLTPAQTSAAEQIISDLRDRGLALRGRSDAAARDGRQEVDRKSAQWIVDNLSPEQRLRLDQIELQWEGTPTLLRPIVAESLDLTKEQRSRLAKAVAERNALRNDGPAVLAVEAKLAEQAFAILDGIQKERWKAMLGPACLFQIAGKTENAAVRR